MMVKIKDIVSNPLVYLVHNGQVLIGKIIDFDNTNQLVTVSINGIKYRSSLHQLYHEFDEATKSIKRCQCGHK